MNTLYGAKFIQTTKDNKDELGADYMGIFSPGWTFSPVWATRDEIFSPVDRVKIPHVIDKKFQPGLKIHKRMRRTLVYNNKYKKIKFPM